jgi:hypothetical protein
VGLERLAWHAVRGVVALPVLGVVVKMIVDLGQVIGHRLQLSGAEMATLLPGDREEEVVHDGSRIHGSGGVPA